MLEDTPSVTAMMVAFARGLSGASQGRSRDRAAETLLPEPFSSTLRAARAAAAGRPKLERAISLATMDMFAHVALRTDAIDRAVEAAVAAGARQLVIVGAGLDARAYRLPTLRQVHVFEVDHPATQRLKLAKAKVLRSAAASLTHVAVDFGRDSLAEALDRAGHDPRVPTVFLWEGVTMYLPQEAIRATLEVLDARSAPKSRVIVSYVEPGFATIYPPLEPAVRAVFGAVGEPLLGIMTTESLHAVLSEYRFDVLSDTGSAEWQRDTTFGERPRIRLHERVTVAEHRA